MNYFNSTIQKKIGKCIDCPPDSPETYLTAGRCWTHYSPHRKKLMLEKQKAKSKFRSLEHTEKNREMLIKNGKIPNPDLELWFRIQMQANDRYCQNCGKSLHYLNDWEWRGSQHHCLEKSLFPSVATNPINHLVLGYYCCHGQFHSSMLNASKMKIFEKAKQIVIKLYPLLSMEEKRKISKYYGEMD